jgi:hypothetical protein
MLPLSETGPLPERHLSEAGSARNAGALRLRDPWDLASGALLAVLLVVVLATFRDYGMAWDEPDHRGYGDRILAYHKGLWTGRPDTSVFTRGNLYLYGGAFDTVTQLVERASPLDPYDSRHLVTALVGLLGVAATVLLARQTGGARTGFLAGGLLALAPLYYGHLFFNPKDIPFAAGTAASLALLLSFLGTLPRPGVLRTASLGVVIGLTLGVRVGGMILLLWLAVGTTWILWSRWRRGAVREGRELVRGAALAAVAALIAWGVMLAAWPWARLAPLANPFRALGLMSRFDWPHTVRFRGEWLPAQDLPRAYLPEYLLLTLPEIFLAGLVLACVCAVSALVLPWRRGAADACSASRLVVSLVAAAGVAPLVVLVLLRPTLYDGARHVLFALPPAGGSRCTGNRRRAARSFEYDSSRT